MRHALSLVAPMGSEQGQVRVRRRTGGSWKGWVTVETVIEAIPDATEIVSPMAIRLLTGKDASTVR
jgi:hypothetical protein